MSYRLVWYEVKNPQKILIKKTKATRKRGRVQMRWVSKGVHLLIKFLVLTGAVLSVLPLVFLISGAFMGESELGQIASPVISGGAGYASWHFIPLYPTFKNIIELLFDTPEYYVLFWNSVKIVGVILSDSLCLLFLRHGDLPEAGTDCRRLYLAYICSA